MRRRVVTVGAWILLASTVASAQLGRRAAGNKVDDPHRLVSAARLLDTVTALAAVRAFEGYRSSATPGEAEGLELVALKLEAMPHLRALGLELEHQSFRMAFGVVPRRSEMMVRVNSAEIELPVSAAAAAGSDLAGAMHCDSDGVLNDLEEDPITATGPVLLVETLDQIEALTPSSVADQVLFLRYSAVDFGSFVDIADLWRRRDARRYLAGLGAAAVVVVTESSNRRHESRGEGAISTPLVAEDGSAPLTLTLRLEDCAAAGITSWQDLGTVEQARLVWDADVVNPGSSANLSATIPGADRSRAVILGAHIDTTNTPGALDDASGVAALLEVARVLDRVRMTPPVDLVLVFFGSEELGLFGSNHWAVTHQDLLERSLAMLQVDCLLGRLDEAPVAISLLAESAAASSRTTIPWLDYLGSLSWGRDLLPVADSGLVSDNIAVQAFNLPNADLIAVDMLDMGSYGFLHGPYDDVPVVHREIDTLVAMTHVALAAALETARNEPLLRETPTPHLRAVVVASHTELPHMASQALHQFATTLAWAGFAYEVVPYGHALLSDHLHDADLVVTLPVFDYEVPENSAPAVDEEWSEDELNLLEEYVADGGLLVISHAAGAMIWGNQRRPGMASEDGDEDNSLATRFGFRFIVEADAITHGPGTVVASHPLVAGLSSVRLGIETGVPLEHQGETLVVEPYGQLPVMAAVPYGEAGGEVVALGDLGILASDTSHWPPEHNVELWQHLAAYASSSRQRSLTQAD